MDALEGDQPDVVVAVLRRSSRILVIRRGPDVSDTDWWTFPTGTVESNESHAEALVREVEEELGYMVRPGRKVWECLTDDGAFRLHWWTATGGLSDPRLAPGEVAESRWVTASGVLGLHPTFEGDRRFVTDVLPALTFEP